MPFWKDMFSEENKQAFIIVLRTLVYFCIHSFLKGLSDLQWQNKHFLT